MTSLESLWERGIRLHHILINTPKTAASWELSQYGSRKSSMAAGAMEQGEARWWCSSWTYTASTEGGRPSTLFSWYSVQWKFLEYYTWTWSTFQGLFPGSHFKMWLPPHCPIPGELLKSFMVLFSGFVAFFIHDAGCWVTLSWSENLCFIVS